MTITIYPPSISGQYTGNSIGAGATPGSQVPVQVDAGGNLLVNLEIDQTLPTTLNVWTQVLSELRIISYLLQSGLNVRDDLDVLRNDPYYQLQ
jgi:hypothetical protein